jgi:hypothetical protein
MTNARELSAQLAALLRREHATMADFLVALADFDHGRLWVELGHSSLFYYLHRELGLSAGSAQYRKTAAELLQRYPEIVEPLRDGRLCLSSVIELAKVITTENWDEVLPRFFHLSAREAAAMAVSIRPTEAAPHREIVIPVRTPTATPAAPCKVDARASSGTDRQAEAAAHLFQTPETKLDATPTAPPLRTVPPQHDTAKPLTAELSRLHVTLSRRVLEKLQVAKDALSHARPGASTEEVLEIALDLLLAREAKKKGIVEKPRAARAAAKQDHIPANVKREVWRRDGARCQWPLESGGICGQRRHLEFDHVLPRARGGLSTASNIRILCKFHNDLAARRVFGDALMDRYTGTRVQAEAGPTARRLPS